MFLGQPCCICIKEDNFYLTGSETDVAGLPYQISFLQDFHVNLVTEIGGVLKVQSTTVLMVLIFRSILF